MFQLKVVIAPAMLLVAGAAVDRAPRTAPRAPLPAIVANDNRSAAGSLKNGVLEVNLEAREGAWRPYGSNGPPITILAFGEKGKSPQTPGPMIRVKAGTRIHATVTNSASGTLVVHGLAARSRPMIDTLVVPSGSTREVTFVASDPGTFFYWGSTTGVGFSNRFYEDVQLNGALIVDAAGAPPRPDRVFVVQWHNPQKLPDGAPNFSNTFFTFNGMPWPYTERLSYDQGDSVHWRIINTTADVHPLHLHGFYFRVTARGDVQRDTLYWPAQERMGVTEVVDEGTTMDMSWLADRPGGWIFHCHLNFHVLPNPTLGAAMKSDSARLHEILSAPDMGVMQQGHAMDNHAETGMGGLVLAMNVKPSASWKPYSGPRERLRLFIQTDSQPSDTARRFGYTLAKGNEVPDPRALRWPGPPLILHKGKPTSIWVINHAPEPSQVHWHGLEIDSYYDGVAGVSSSGGMVSPMIMPRDSFEVTLTPPRAGSFMYHTHINDIRQQSHGLYGPIIVLDSGQTWDPENDLIFQAGTDPTDNPILNGSKSPPPLTLHPGKPYRIRLMNVTLDNPFFQYWLTAADGAAIKWTPIAKDGFDRPAWQRRSDWSRQHVSIGETYDFRVTFPDTGQYAMEARIGTGTIIGRQAIHVVK
ncbi:MAG TPA: multicopper oxidase domain-containing protein [Gemmatimonadaceae bacterium]|nr:multicopper oxidase domain-containing protein [Gemmatimonadaceae bacterium]